MQHPPLPAAVSTDLASAWDAHAHRNDIPQHREGWLRHPTTCPGWNPYRERDLTLPSSPPPSSSSSPPPPAGAKDAAEGSAEEGGAAAAEAALQRYTEWCGAYHHALVRREPPEVVRRCEDAMREADARCGPSPAARARVLNVRAEQAERYLDASARLADLPTLKKCFRFDAAAEAAAGSDPVLGRTHDPLSGAPLLPAGGGGSTQGGQQPRGGRAVAASRAEKEAAVRRRRAARACWAKVATHVKLTLLQDNVVKSAAGGECYCSHTAPFAHLSRCTPFDYGEVDARVAAYKSGGVYAEGLSLEEVTRQLLAPYARVTWLCSATQQAHHGLRTLYTFLTTTFKQSKAEVAPAGGGPDDFTANVQTAWQKKEATSYEMALIFQMMCHGCSGGGDAAAVAAVSSPDAAAGGEGGWGVQGGCEIRVVKGWGKVGEAASGGNKGWQAWCVATYGGKSYLMNPYKGVESEYYWCTPPTTFITEHLPIEAQAAEQLSVKPVDASAWDVSPHLTRHFHTHGLSLISHAKYCHVVAKSPPLHIQLGMADPNVDITAVLYEGPLNGTRTEASRLPDGHVWQERLLSSSVVNFYAVLPDTGIYSMDIMVQRRGVDEAPQRATAYQIGSSVKVCDDPLLPGQKVPPSVAVLASPGLAKLAAGTCCEFAVYPCTTDIEGFVLVERRRASAAKPGGGGGGSASPTGASASQPACVVHTVMRYDALRGAFAATLPELRRGTLDVYMRLRGSGEFVAAFTGFTVVTALSAKESMNGVPVVPPVGAEEAAAIAHMFTAAAGEPRPPSTQALRSSLLDTHVGAYFRAP